MAWTVEFSKTADSSLEKLDSTMARRILKFINERIAKLDDPRSIGQALRGPKFGELWKYRVGDYRIICRIEDEELLILVVRIGHRREVYRL